MFTVTTQQINCGPCTTATFNDRSAASAAFDTAVAQGAIFVELYDEESQCQLSVVFPLPQWV